MDRSLARTRSITGGEVSIDGLTAESAKGDVRIVDHLRGVGCRAGFGSRGIFAGGEVLRGVELDLSGEPDLAPVAAALAIPRNA